jgi:predicted RNA binding protein YcfA (HicA-like mRNA interferase family)
VQPEHPARPSKVTAPVHAGRVIGPKTLANVLRQAGLSADGLRALL